jgi:hypothetical protein
VFPDDEQPNSAVFMDSRLRGNDEIPAFPYESPQALEQRAFKEENYTNPLILRST